jgi:hypothetical protein
LREQLASAKKETAKKSSVRSTALLKTPLLISIRTNFSKRLITYAAKTS